MGRFVTRSTVVPDITPAAFSFSDQTDVALSSTITSAAVTISGINQTVTFTASGGTIDVNSDGNFQVSRNVSNGNTIRARVTSSGSNSTAANCIVTATPSGVTDTFTATTLAGGVGPGAGPDDVLTMDFSAAPALAAGNAGYNQGLSDPSGRLGVYLNLHRRAGAGPYGDDVFEVEQLLGDGTEQGAVWTHGPIPYATFPGGSSVFCRWWYRIVTDGGWNSKWAEIFGANGEPSDNHTMYAPQGGGQHRWLGSHGGDMYFAGADYASRTSEAFTPDIASTNVWRWVQTEHRLATVSGAADSAWKIWVNNNTYASPTKTVDPINGDISAAPASVGGNYTLYFPSFMKFPSPGTAVVQWGGQCWAREFHPTFYDPP